MARALGTNARILLALESSYGTAPASGSYWLMPIISTDLGGEQALQDDDTLGLGRDPQAPTYDVLKVGGQIVVPLDLQALGYWLKLALGAPTTTGSTNYTHTFVSGGTTQVSATIEIGYPDLGAYFLCKGCVVASMQFSVGRSGAPQATLQIMAQNEVKSGSTVDASPDTLTLTRFHKFQGNIKRNGSSLANLVSGDLTYANSAESVETVRADDLVEAIDFGMSKLSGSLVARFAATTLHDDAVAQTAIDIDYIWTIDSNNSLTLATQSAYLPRAKRSISGPGGVEATYAWQGALDSGEGEMLEVVLKNTKATYVNAA